MRKYTWARLSQSGNTATLSLTCWILTLSWSARSDQSIPCGMRWRVMTVLWRVIMIVTCWNIFHLKNGNLTWTGLSYQKVSCRLDPVVHDAIISILQNSFKAHLFLPSLFPFFSTVLCCRLRHFNPIAPLSSLIINGYQWCFKKTMRNTGMGEGGGGGFKGRDCYS